MPIENNADCSNYQPNSTNASSQSIDLDVHTTIAGLASFVLVLPFVLFHFRWFPIGTTSAVLVGAFLMVITLVVDQDEVYDVLGSHENLRTIFLLLGMMLLAQYFERELLIEKAMQRFLKANATFVWYLFLVTIADFFLAAVFTNDVACVVITPLVLEHWRAAKRPSVELSTLLLGIATTANIGSATTIFGNPQMALIASKTSVQAYKLSELNMRRCILYLWLPAAVLYVINFAFLVAHYRIRLWLKPKRLQKTVDLLQKSSPAIHRKKSVSSERPQRDRAGSCDMRELPVIIEHRVLEIEPASRADVDAIVTADGDEQVEMSRLNSRSVSQSSTVHDASQQDGFPISTNVLRSISIASVASIPVVQAPAHDGDSMTSFHVDDKVPLDFQSSNSTVFKVALCLSVLLVIALFLGSGESVSFDMGLVPMGAAILCICLDAAINKRAALTLMKRVDWSVLMMFFGIFVWLYGFNETQLPRYIWQKLGLDTGLVDVKSHVILYIFVVLGSNIFSNVPLTIIVLELLTPCANQLDLTLYLAWLSTIAGNLTLFGSVANLIVASKALQTLNYRLTFFEYLEFGLVTTLFLSILGMVLVNLLLTSY